MADMDWSVVFSGQGLQQLGTGLANTLELAAVALVGALLLGTVIAALRMTNNTVAATCCKWYVECVRSIPLVVHVFFWYYAAPEALSASAKACLYDHDASFLAAAIALTLYSSAFISEDLRSGVRAIGKGQLEAAMALGFGHGQAIRLIAIPQALRLAAAPLLGQAMTLTKNTSVALLVGVPELIMQARRLHDATFRTVEVFGVATLVYVLICAALTLLSVLCEKRWNNHRTQASYA